MQIWRSRVEPGLDCQRPSPPQLFLQLGLDEDLIGAAPDDFKAFVNRHVASHPLVALVARKRTTVAETRILRRTPLELLGSLPIQRLVFG